MALYNELIGAFRKHHAVLLGVSVDGPWCHGAFAEARKLHFPLLSDLEPKGAVAQRPPRASRVTDDVESNACEERVRSDFMFGVHSGVNGTPTFFINGVRYDGDWAPVATFAAHLESAIG